MISLNGLMLDGSMMGYVLLAFVVVFEILYCVAMICVIVMARRLKKNQARTEQYLESIEQELRTLNHALAEKKIADDDVKS